MPVQKTPRPLGTPPMEVNRNRTLAIDSPVAIPSRYGHPASGLGNDGRRKRLKLQSQSFKLPLPKAARPLPIFHQVLVLPKQSFNDFIQQQFQALRYS